MRLTAELIGNGPLNDTQKDHLSTLLRAIDSLDQMTAELITDVAPEPFGGETTETISSVIRDCTDLFQVAAQNKGLQLEASLQAVAGRARPFQGGKLRRALSALLDNAVKYTENGRITVDVISCPQPQDAGDLPVHALSSGEPACWVSVSVTDTGPGIDPEERQALFRPFVRGRTVRDAAPGTGLGLWGTLKTVRQMGGRLLLKPSDGGGSRFEIHIPAAHPVSRTEQAQAEGPDQGAAEKPRELPDQVLIVDDNDTNCRLLAALLESFGVASDIVHSGEQAIGYVQKGDYGAVLLDLNMPGMGGIETAEELRAFRSAEELPLIAVTAALEAFGDKRLRSTGFQEVLAKPLSPSALLEALVRAQRVKSVHWV
jgi:CheY-like chemotaxis protein